MSGILLAREMLGKMRPNVWTVICVTLVRNLAIIQSVLRNPLSDYQQGKDRIQYTYLKEEFSFKQARHDEDSKIHE